MRKLNDYCSEEFKNLYADYTVNLRSVRSVDEYTSCINMITAFLGEDFLAITRDGANSYFEKLTADMRDGRLARKTFCLRLSCFNSIAEYIEGREEEYENPFRQIRRPEVDDSIKVKNIPTMAELDRIIEEAKRDPMWYLILCLAFRACLSATLITRIRMQNIHIEGDERVFLFFPATNTMPNDLYVQLPNDIKWLLLDYIKGCTQDELGHIFFNEHHNPLTIRNIDAAVKRFVKASGVEGDYTIKDLRSRGVLELVNAGASSEVIGEYTGLSQLRVRSFVQSKHLIGGECPADLVNFRLKEKAV